MKIIFATGIFPPEIGGPATYVRGLARELVAKGERVTVVAYGTASSEEQCEGYTVVRIGRQGGPIVRWLRYRRALVRHGSNAEYLCAFTSISAGVPVLLSRLRKPMKILRLGGDFFWERYTDAGGTMSLCAWYASRLGFWRILNALVMPRVLRTFHRLVYSTEFQRDIHTRTYRRLPPSTVESNARPQSVFVPHEKHTPFRLLFMGRFVRFKNIPSLIDAVALLPDVALTIIGDGPIKNELTERVAKLGLGARIRFLPPVHGDAKAAAFAEHDLLVLPSFTEISPNTALEARSMCLPVLLTEETGLPAIPGIITKRLRNPHEIATAVRDIIAHYPSPRAEEGARSYRTISDALFPPIVR